MIGSVRLARLRASPSWPAERLDDMLSICSGGLARLEHAKRTGVVGDGTERDVDQLRQALEAECALLTRLRRELRTPLKYAFHSVAPLERILQGLAGMHPKNRAAMDAWDAANERRTPQ